MHSDFYLNLLDEIADGVYFVSLDRRITYWNAGAEHITGYTAAEVVGHSCSEGILRHVNGVGTQLCRHGCPLAAVMRDGKKREADVYLHHKDGHRVPVSVRGQALRDDAGDIIGSVEIFSPRIASPYAVTPMTAADASLDPVTHLPPRRMGEARLESMLADVRSDDLRLGVIFADLDRFKDINDTYGHTTGDRVLRMAGQSIANALLRGDLPVRWGGEEFVVLLPGADRESLEATAERIRMLVANSWLQCGEAEVRITVSVGATMATGDDTAESLLDRADRHMYRSKRAGRNRVTTDSDTLTVTAEEPLRGSRAPWEMPEFADRFDPAIP
ncbi:MAG: sensor domain-containing diguanylate cyclase [Actinobacteria bacterium]|nr:sensor domain-containing diguanylate cyclase [Actinomycetota bacterium]